MHRKYALLIQYPTPVAGFEPATFHLLSRYPSGKHKIVGTILASGVVWWTPVIYAHFLFYMISGCSCCQLKTSEDKGDYRSLITIVALTKFEDPAVTRNVSVPSVQIYDGKLLYQNEPANPPLK